MPEKKVETKPDAPKTDVVPFEALTGAVAAEFKIEPKAMWAAVKAECFPGGAASDAQMFMFLQAVDRYKLNPFMKEIYAAVSQKTGKLIIGVQVDGWATLAHRHEQYAGYQFEYEKDKDGNVIVVTCKVHRKDWQYPGEFRAEMKEWKLENKDTWGQRPVHQLCVKAFNNAVRFTLGLTGIYDPDDMERIQAEENEAKRPAIETTATKTSPVDAAPTTTGDESTEQGGAREPETVSRAASAKQAAASSPGTAPAEPPQNGEKETTSPSPSGGKVREELDAFISKHVTNARLQILLAQAGASKVEDLSDEQAKMLLAKLQKRGK